MLEYMCLTILIWAKVFANEDGKVKIDQGVLQGRTAKTEQDRTFSSFTGVPYAKPPVGALRFEPPVPAEPWEGVLDATKPHNICPQVRRLPGNYTVAGDEDCLYLNVYTPQLPKDGSKALPVMFFIHGGGYAVGSARDDALGPQLLLNKDVVLVVANYRLGPLGFLTTGDQVVPGNMGMKDQALALRWTKKNIAHFGGDPDAITVFGQSAGGPSAEFHMYSPLSRDLMKGVIAQSGDAMTLLAWGPLEAVENRSKTLAKYVNCEASKTQEMVRCLKKVGVEDIIKHVPKFLVTDLDPLTPFKPVVEPKVEGAFLPESSVKILESGKAANVPLMLGITPDEGAFRTASIFHGRNPDMLQKLNHNFEETLPLILNYDGHAPDVIARNAKKIRSFYFGDKPINDSLKYNFTKMYTDALFFMPTIDTIDLHSKYTQKPIYYYLFSYHGSISFCPPVGEAAGGKVVCHGDDLLYLFSSKSRAPNYKPTEEDQKVTELLTTLWTNFAKYGNPTPESDSKVKAKWEPVKEGKYNYYEIKSGTDVKMGERLYEDRLTFWKNLV